MEEDTLCPWCGAYSKRACELKEGMGSCPWEESDGDTEDASIRAAAKGERG